MIAALVRALRPVFAPLLKLRLEPPHLPEGATEVRHLKPAEGYLSYRYVGVLLAAVVKAWVLGVLAVVAVAKLGLWGLLIAVPLALLLLFLVGLTAVATRLDWELRDYLIGDRSLRVRQGALVQREVTLSFANVQNVEVTQGPIERLFGFKSLKVTTAGGSHNPYKKELFNSHEAILAGLTNAAEIREVVMDALREIAHGGALRQHERASRVGGCPGSFVCTRIRCSSEKSSGRSASRPSPRKADTGESGRARNAVASRASARNVPSSSRSLLLPSARTGRRATSGDSGVVPAAGIGATRLRSSRWAISRAASSTSSAARSSTISTPSA